MKVNNKKKREKPEDFIGWKSPDGKLEVIGIYGKDRRGGALFKVTCTECSKDPELFPDGYFVSVKGSMIRGIKPCGCGKNVRWKDFQYLILARRAAKDLFIVHGFVDGFRNQKTKLNLECLKDGHKWTARVHHVINSFSGCPKCRDISSAEQKRTPEHVALQKCIDICKEIDYNVVGFVGGYKNANTTRFEYICKIHGKQNVRYHDFVNGGTRCNGCWRDKQKELGNGNGYFPERRDEQDFLYILDFDGKFIKVGRSFDVERRLGELQKDSGIPDIIKLRIFTATHQEIYDLEQDLHAELRGRNFQHYVGWSNECFENECQYILNRLLDTCKLEEIIT